jgi:adenosylcobinamide-GDP ribazoletransferase
VSALFAALQFLTLCPWPARMDYTDADIGRSAIFFPVIGLILGSILVVVNFVLAPFASAALLSVILVGLLAFVTRGLHLDGLGDTFDGLGTGGGRDRMLTVMGDSRIGVFGLIAVVLVLLLKIHALESIDADRWQTLLIALILGRWAMVLLAYRSKAAKDGLGSRLIDHLKTKYFLIATLLTLLLVAAIWRSNGIVMMAWVAIFTVASKTYFHRRLGGVTGDTCGAVGELSETSVMVLLAL